MGERNNFTFYLTGASEVEAAALRYVERMTAMEGKKGHSVRFRLTYTPPYGCFEGIREFQCKSQYRPFVDGTEREKYAVIDLTEWLGHEQEEYLEIFAKFLHDYRPFFNYEYIFTVRNKDRKEIMGLYKLMSMYLHEGRIVEDQSLHEEVALGSLLRDRYGVEEGAAGRLAGIFIQNDIGGLAQIHTIMEDVQARIGEIPGAKLSEKNIVLSPVMRESKLMLFYPEEMRQWSSEIDRVGKKFVKQRGIA